MKLIIDNSHFSLKKIESFTTVEVSEDKNFQNEIRLAQSFLMEELKSGKPIYGVNTGFGASGKNFLNSEDSERLQQNLYRFHGCGVGESLNIQESLYTILFRLISLSKGKSGISLELLERLTLLINMQIIPLIPSQGSVGASGDLTPLSYLASVLAGEGDVYFKDKVVDVEIVYKNLKISPYRFKPKEVLAIMNGTSIMCAIAYCSIRKFERLLNTMESFVAGLYEVLLCDETPLLDFVHQVKPFVGQGKTAKNILEKIKGSSLVQGREDRYSNYFNDDSLNIQDPYSIRCVPQILGVVRDNLEITKNWLEIEINSVNDNPIIDAKERKIYTSGNFYGGYIAHGVDTLKISIANMADLLDKEFALLVDHKLNRGLGENLKLNRENIYHGFKAMQITVSSLAADIIKNSAPASIFSRPTESLNQDKVSMGTTSALDLKKMIPDLTNMLSIALLGLVQAVEIRGKEKVSTVLKKIHEKVRATSLSLTEDRRMDRDIQKIAKMIEEGDFV